jgi:hypothetical protein
MSARAFSLSIAGLVALLLAASAPFPGALIGFFLGIAVAFFVAPFSFLGAKALTSIGIAASYKDVAMALIAAYVLLALVAAWRAWRSWSRDGAETARLLTLHALILAFLPAIAWLSSQALVRAWP